MVAKVVARTRAKVVAPDGELGRNLAGASEFTMSRSEFYCTYWLDLQSLAGITV